MSDFQDWLSIAAGGDDPVTIIDDVFTGKELRLVPGEVKTLVEDPGESAVDPTGERPTTGDPPAKPPVWRPKPLPLGEGSEMMLDLDDPELPTLDASGLHALASGQTLKIHVTGSDRLRLGQIEGLLRKAHETSGHLHIDVDRRV